MTVVYKITNTTNETITGIKVQKLPTNVTQVTCDPKYCGAEFTLGAKGFANDTCFLKLTVKGAVHAIPADMLICTATECDTTLDPLNISLGASLPFIGVNVGYYSDHHGGIFPLLAETHDTGINWSYPTTIFQDLKDRIDPSFQTGILSAVGCNETFNQSVCVAAGQWCKGAFCDNPIPLIAVGNKGTYWQYPKSAFQDLQTRIDPNLTGALFRSSSCFGSGPNAICIAGGTYFTATNYFPLLGRSGNGGFTWTYPTTIFQNLTTAIDPTFKSGSLFSTSCTKSTCESVCVASGNFCTTDNCDFQRPLVAVSKDKGLTWVYPHEIFQDLTTKIDPALRDAFFVSTNCTGTGIHAICTSVGSYTNSKVVLPLLALTRDGGTTWTYPKEIFQNLNITIGHGFVAGVMNATSCSGSENKAICIGAGGYFTTGSQFPTIALTRDGGLTWTYSDFIYTKLKTLVDPNFARGSFNGASCIDTGKKGICVAAGGYCRSHNSLCLPLIAVTDNGGKSWFYPPSVYKNAIHIDPNFQYGFFSDVNCQGVAEHNFCMASGQYLNDKEILPLVAISTDSGNTWTYPSYIYQNLQTVIDPDFSTGSFSGGGTSGGEFKLSFRKKVFGFEENLNTQWKTL